MSVTLTVSRPGKQILSLDSGNGRVEREISTAPLRDCTEEDINIIDISGIYGDFEARKAVAMKIKHASENSGFFYIENHGIKEEVIQTAYEQAKRFIEQPLEDKLMVHNNKYKFFNGYAKRGTTHGNKTEPKDLKEHFSWQYDPRWDPLYDGVADPINTVSEDLVPWIQSEDVWTGTSQIQGFKEACIEYSRECLNLGRRLMRIFAIALGLEENHFDRMMTHPGLTNTLNFYPPSGLVEDESLKIGLGSHTDIQMFTMLWQDSIGGLNVLNQKGEWVRAVPITGTFVVNIADFLTRLTNGRWLSTVHQVALNTSQSLRINANVKVGVLPSCIDKNNPLKYEPLSIGEWNLIRMSDYEGPKKSK
ncbi:2OG-Fe(II) oxygenase superfamily protein [Aspergillus cavernicola]|uniref:2OG-Fe(II) oxygenase superfamily protein n=1 Tax=Aspergillus cavernicola TaxID=176166 RepID=A0ABR4HRP2_9EURO